MKTIEERAKEYAPDPFLAALERKAYIAGATEQKSIDEEVRLKKSDDMTQAEYDREVAFAEWYLKNGTGTPTYSDAIEWTRKKLLEEAIEKACSILEDMTEGRLGKRFISEFKNKLKYGVLERH